MSKRNNFWMGATVAVFLASPAFAEGETAETVIATIGETEITLGHMITTKNQLPEQYQSLPDEVLFEGILDQLIQQTVLADSLDGDVSGTTKLLIENETRAIMAGEALDQVVSAAVTEDAIQNTYDTKYANAEPATEYNASHILVDTEDEVKELVQMLSDGSDFAELAREKSTGPSGPSGGLLGWFGAGMMVPEFEAAVVGLEVGQVSAPVQTQFGWHVIILNETRLQEAPEIETVRGELEAEIQQTAVENVIAELTEGASIMRPETGSFDASLLSNTDLIEN